MKEEVEEEEGRSRWRLTCLSSDDCWETRLAERSRGESWNDPGCDVIRREWGSAGGVLLVSLSSGPWAQAQSPACVPGDRGACIYIQCHKGQGERVGQP